MTNKTIIIAVVVILAILVISGGSYAAYYYFLKDKGDTAGESITEKLGITEKSEVQEPEKVTAEQKPEEEVTEEEESTEDTEEAETKDSDSDGLTDAEEAKYKTDPNKKDTDGDGYSDYVEVKSGNDPLKKPEEETKTDDSTTSEDSEEDTDTGTTQAYPDPQDKMYVFFMHHSTGEIYWDGGLEKALTDHNYVGYAPWWDGETDPPDFYGEFSDEDKWNIIASSNMPEGKTRDIVLFKSCFPSSDITSDEMLADYKTYYKKLFEIYAAHPNMLFVPMSTPPLLEANTTAEAASRAGEFETWLTIDYVADYEKYTKNNLTYNNRDYNIGGFRIPKGLFSFTNKNKQVSNAIAQNSESGINLAPFQLHSLLADSNGYLASAYQSDTGDDHPNSKSGEVVGEAMWKHLNKAIVEASMVE